MEYNPSLFWDLSIQEVYDLVESYQRRQKLKSEEYEAKLKAEISLNATLAKQIGEYVSCLFSKDAQITPLEKLFPTLFSFEEAEEEQIKNDMVLYKAKMEDYAFRYNSRLGKGD